jgi:hypothetical protein
MNPSGPLRDATGCPVDHPPETAQTIVVRATRQDPPVPAEVAALITLLCENMSYIGQHVELAPHEPNPHPWVEEPQALQHGPLTGISVIWLDTSASHSDTHCWVLPTTILVLQGKQGNHSPWIAERYATSESQLQEPDGTPQYQVQHTSLPIPIQAWAANKNPVLRQR